MQLSSKKIIKIRIKRRNDATFETKRDGAARWFSATFRCALLGVALGGTFGFVDETSAQSWNRSPRPFGFFERAALENEAASDRDVSRPKPRRALSSNGVYSSAYLQNSSGNASGVRSVAASSLDFNGNNDFNDAALRSGENARLTGNWQNAPGAPFDANVLKTAGYSEKSARLERLETLNEAMELAVSASRSQRALALKTGAARSATDAARSLRNPKITNATAYVGMLNQPEVRSEVDLSGLVADLPPSVAPIFAGLPSTVDATTLVSDKNFVATTTAATLPVYLGGRVQALTRSADALARAASAGEDVGEQNVRWETAEAYFLVLRARKLRDVAAEATRSADAHLTDARRMFAVGAITKNVVLAADVALAEARQTELRVANAQLLAEAAFNRLLWRPLDAPVRIADVDCAAVAPLGDFEAAVARAVRNRGELRAISEQSRAMREQENVARADVLPQVALVGAYSYVENSRLTENSNATGAVGMVWTPFDGGTSRAKRDAARQGALALARARDEAESAIRLQVYQSWLAESEARERVEVARGAVAQAEENFRVVSRAFQEGMVNHSEVLDALTLRTAAKTNFANAQYDAILATQRALRAVGEL